MYTAKQQAINHYLETVNKVDEVVWVSADKMIAILNEHALLKEAVKVELPPRVEADWDTNDTKEFDRLLYKILFKERVLH